MSINKKSIAKSSEKLPTKIRTIVRDAAGIKTTKRVAKKKQQQVPMREVAMVIVLIIVVFLCFYHLSMNMQ